MTGKVILICGKICCGKSTYAKKLMEQYNAVLLSCDEIAFAVFDGNMGNRHDELTARIKNYLYEKSVEITGTGINVILDWGFWKKSWRDYAKDFYERHNIPAELHCISLSDEVWKGYIAERNKAVSAGERTDYFVDEGLMKKAEALFEEPDESEIDVWY